MAYHFVRVVSYAYVIKLCFHDLSPRRSMSLSLIVVILLAVVRQPDSSTVDTKNSDVAYVIVIFLGFMLICVLSYRVFKFCTR